MLAVVSFCALVAVIIGIHEGGHLLAARWLKVNPEQFAIGMGPVLWQRYDSRGMAVQIRLLPVGGFVDIPPEVMRAIPPLARAFLYLAGPAANLITGAALMFALGVAHGHGAGETIRLVGGVTVDLFSGMFEAIGSIVSSAHASDLGGPVTVANFAADAVRQAADTGSASPILILLGIVSISIGAINLLPIPILDGGQICACLVERFTGPFHPRVERALNAIGLVLVGGIMLAAICSDIARLL